MRKLMLLLAAGSLWLFLAALPVFADGGPHVKDLNSGVSNLTADSCAGCHRAHTASAPLLLNGSEETLCFSCHGSASTGATTDVATGVQYAMVTPGNPRGTAELGALRGGGFEEARIGDPYRWIVGIDSFKSKVQVKNDGAGNTAPAPVTSAHINLHATGTALENPGVAWGQGANGTGVGTTLTLGCATCHNPHGNGKYRILNPVPVSTTFNASVARVYSYTGTTKVYKTVASHGFLVGDTIVVAGSAADTAAAGAVVATVPNDTSFTLTGITAAVDGLGGTATLSGGASVTDAALPPAGDARNYTVIQTSAEAGFTLLASQAEAFDPTQGDYFHYRVPWDSSGTVSATSPGYNYDAPNGVPGTLAVSGGRWGGVVGQRSFQQEITAWCSSCHTRYFAYSEPTNATGGTGAAYNTARPSTPAYNATPDSVYTYQHRTRGSSARGCLTCHVSHGSNAIMNGAYSSTFTYPDAPGGTAAIVSDSSRLLKVSNRGTCQLCHDPTGTADVGNNPLPATMPSVP